MNNTHNVAEAVERITKEIRTLERQHRRKPESVALLAVSKTKPIEAIRAAYAAGQRHFGENYLDEAVEKIQTLSREYPEEIYHWHFIGGIQSRKTQAIAEAFDWVHSVDRVKIINRLAAQRPIDLPPLNICLQVNLDNEAGKSGAAESELSSLADACELHEQLQLRGLMAIPAPRSGIEEQRKPFAKLATLFESLRQTHTKMDTLSIGMSADLPAAIAEGATIVRVGTAIFGQRA
ncbi:MAG: YggS family pyridoxal phosphate-dependent enzyme [Granulosicoccaceae bacterium]